jgi:arginase
MTTLRLVGVPSSAGAHAPGVERGPGHLRAAGIERELAAAGVDVVDGSDVPAAHFATTAAPSGARNLPAVIQNIRHVAGQVAAARQAGQIPILLGGDCTLVLGAVLGLRQHGCAATSIGLLYLDGDADLDTPGEGWGVLDSCGVAHLLGDGDEALSRLAPGGPLVDAAGVVLFGFHPAQLSAGQWRRFAAHRMLGVPVTDIPSGQSAQAARDALHTLAGRDALLVHLDVDVIDFPSFPLADCPRYHGGLSLPDTMAAVRIAAGHPNLACLTITEVNPDHDPDAILTRELVIAWSRAIAAGLRDRRAVDSHARGRTTLPHI